MPQADEKAPSSYGRVNPMQGIRRIWIPAGASGEVLEAVIELAESMALELAKCRCRSDEEVELHHLRFELALRSAVTLNGGSYSFEQVNSSSD